MAHLAASRVDGTHYFYANPLESRGQHRRWDWHLCPCCTMNVSRLVASIGGYAISTRGDGLAIHLYGGFETAAKIGGQDVRIRRESSDYPWSGDIRIAVEPDAPAAFDLKLRIPAWANGARRRSMASLRGCPSCAATRRSASVGGRAMLSRFVCRCRLSGSTPIPACAWTLAARRCAAALSSIASRRPTIPADRFRR